MDTNKTQEVKEAFYDHDSVGTSLPSGRCARLCSYKGRAKQHQLP